jgi:CHAT domain-containing protein
MALRPARFFPGVRDWRFVTLAVLVVTLSACHKSATVSDQEAFAEAEKQRGWGTKQSLQAALQIYDTLSEKALRANQPREALKMSLKGGETAWSLTGPQAALTRYDRAIASLQPYLTQEEKLRLTAVRALAFLELADTERAEPLFQLLSSVIANVTDLRIRAEIHQALGEYQYQLGQLPEAISQYDSSFNLWTELADDRGQVWTRMQRGQTYSDSGQPQAALADLEWAQARWRDLCDRRNEGLAFAYLGRFHTRRGEQQRARKMFAEARRLFEACGDEKLVWVLSGEGFVLETMGQYAAANERYVQALLMIPPAERDSERAELLHEIGRSYYLLEDYARACDAFTKFYQIAAGLKNSRFRAHALRSLGMVFAKTHDSKQALNAYLEALPVLHKLGDERGAAYLLDLIGQLYEEENRLVDAQTALTQSLALSLKAEDRTRESLSRYHLAHVLWQQGQRRLAQSQVEQALNQIENLRTKVTRTDLRASYLASVQPVYELAVHLWMEKTATGASSSAAAQAWQVSERARARGLLDALHEASALNINEATPALVAQQHELQLQLNAARDPKTIKSLIEKRNEVEALLRESLPQYAALVQPEPLTLPRLQAELDAQTTLLEFSLGEPHSYLWEITKNECRAYRLAPRREMEKAVQALLPALRPGNYLRSQERWQAFDASATELSKMLLAQVAPRLGQRALLIVADGALQYVPFAALTAAPRTSGDSIKSYQPLMLQHDISYLPSASTLALLRHHSARQRPQSTEIHVFADPRFSLQEEPSKSALLAQKQNDSSLRAAADVPLPRLPETRREAQAITVLAPEAQLHIREDANVAAVKNLSARHYRVVHLATHAKPDTTNPELSAIFLAAFDANGQPLESRLHLPEIYQLPWSAELVVLSACETALGQEIRGEGLVNLARGFMYTGTPRILASLWKVDDQATYELMQVFYRQHLNTGQSPRAALRAAQKALWQSEAWNWPWHWAAFTLQGEFR